MAKSAGLRILVVDDNADGAELLAEALQVFGHEVQIAHDGPEALELAKEFDPELAFLDIGLPIMTGYELAQRFRDDPTLARVKLVAITGYSQEQDRSRSRAAGFDAHLVKPVELDSVKRLIDELAAS